MSFMAVSLKGRAVPIAAGAAAAVAVTVGGAFWWIDRQKFESTDNAFVAADKVTVAPLVDGYVAEVLVEDNQPVRPGQLLIRIDPATLKARLAQAEANARAQLAAVSAVDDKGRLEQAMIAQKAAAVESARAQQKWAASEMDRYGALARSGWVSPQQAQTARNAQEQAVAGVSQAKAALEAERRAAQALAWVVWTFWVETQPCLARASSRIKSALARPWSAWALATPAARWAIIACSRAALSSTLWLAASRAWALAMAWSSLACSGAGSIRATIWPASTRWLSATSTCAT
jgi:multidrug efflux pump subunit AcrA (membrane-fusion protein)